MALLPFLKNSIALRYLKQRRLYSLLSENVDTNYQGTGITSTNNLKLQQLKTGNNETEVYRISFLVFFDNAD